MKVFSYLGRTVNQKCKIININPRFSLYFSVMRINFMVMKISQVNALTDHLCFTVFYFGKLSGPVSEEFIYNSPVAIFRPPWSQFGMMK